MTDSDKIGRRDWIIAAAFFLVSLALRVPFRAHYAYHWDSAQFSLAIEHFDIRQGVPHPPGFFLYVMLGRCVNWLVGDPHASLVWISVVAGSVLSAVGYLLGRTMFGWRCGLTAGVILTTSLLTWFHSEVALTTIVDGALVTTLALVCWLAIRTGLSWGAVLLVSVLLSTIAGVRSQSLPVILPLVGYVFFRTKQYRFQKIAAGILICGVLCAFWFVPMLATSGGLGAYLREMRTKARLDLRFEFFGRGMSAVENSGSMIIGACWAGLLFPGLIAGIELVVLVFLTPQEIRWDWFRESREQIKFLFVWVVPGCLLGVGLYTFLPGHILNYFIAVVIGASLLTNLLIQRISEGKKKAGNAWLVIFLFGTAVTNATVFLFPSAYSEKLLGQLRVTRSEIEQHDRTLAGWIHLIRERYDPRTTIIFHHNQSFYWGIRHFQLHLPEFKNVLLTPDPALEPSLRNKYLLAQNHQMTFLNKIDFGVGKHLILVVPPGSSVDDFAEHCGMQDVMCLDREKPGCLFEVQCSKGLDRAH